MKTGKALDIIEKAIDMAFQKNEENKQKLKKAVSLLQDLAEFQNGSPLVQDKDDYDRTMNEIWKFLKENE